MESLKWFDVKGRLIILSIFILEISVRVFIGFYILGISMF